MRQVSQTEEVWAACRTHARRPHCAQWCGYGVVHTPWWVSVCEGRGCASNEEAANDGREGATTRRDERARRTYERFRVVAGAECPLR